MFYSGSAKVSNLDNIMTKIQLEKKLFLYNLLQKDKLFITREYLYSL